MVAIFLTSIWTAFGFFVDAAWVEGTGAFVGDAADDDDDEGEGFGGACCMKGVVGSGIGHLGRIRRQTREDGEDNACEKEREDI